jgi:hypothetical protein
MLSVLDSVLDSDILEPIIVIQEAEKINNYGRAELTPTYLKVEAVVTKSKEAQVTRLRDSTNYQQFITCTSAYVFRGDNFSGQNDRVIWQNNTYTVLAVDDNSNRGYTRAYCGLLELQVSIDLNSLGGIKNWSYGDCHGLD